ncbi:hypothetical protein [Gloeobacter kilaueensis]|uniref:Uncharacterized protein n=1 Tax=Gloeobacter kilaueensis (strain ATCC BAA-2537 / CCAP 1431/1 / ULC 316 / JS1) TaxID=1183438 RepID=U5QGN5_GLOK1|nr:hypothetical protein [Gloeobacter kilaueensis]AGY58043.1 hypothetical protein GKIL_1797 [Gloeobacter kilaueensis JS1]
MTIDPTKNWLDLAVQLEEAADCDISAGLDLGAYLSEYLAEICSDRRIVHEAVLEVLLEKFGDFLSPRDLEEIAIVTQERLIAKLRQKFKPPIVA